MLTLEDLKNGLGQQYYNNAKSLIPGGTQLLSKRPEMFAPGLWPAYYSKAKGYKVWDLEGLEYLDMSIMGIGACSLGYADEDIDNAVINAIKNGSASTLNCAEEIELAKELTRLHPWFDMVRYAKSGGEAVSIAIRIARAYTNKEVVLFSGYHGWSDWYIAANLSNKKGLDGQLMPGLSPNGVPRSLSGTAIPFDLNNFDEVYNLMKKYKGKVAAIILEPARGNSPPVQILQKIKDLAANDDAVLIYDEITSGFRECTGGIHRSFDAHPDLAVFAKGMGNGYPISAIIGSSSVMESAQSTFISSTNWTERVGLVAALSVIKKFESHDVPKHLKLTGKHVKEIWKKAADKNNLNIKISGLDSLPSFAFLDKDTEYFNSVLCVEMLKRQMLGFRQFKPSFAHDQLVIQKFEDNINEIFDLLKNRKFNTNDYPEPHSGFHRVVKE